MRWPFYLNWNSHLRIQRNQKWMSFLTHKNSLFSRFFPGIFKLGCFKSYPPPRKESLDPSMKTPFSQKSFNKESLNSLFSSFNLIRNIQIDRGLPWGLGFLRRPSKTCLIVRGGGARYVSRPLKPTCLDHTSDQRLSREPISSFGRILNNPATESCFGPEIRHNTLFSKTNNLSWALSVRFHDSQP